MFTPADAVYMTRTQSEYDKEIPHNLSRSEDYHLNLKT